MKFKIGDKVKRIKGTNSGFRKGDIGTIVGFNEYDNLNIKMSNGEISNRNDRKFIKLVSSNYKSKTPTHVVIWEEDRDPAKLFTSKEEALDFIKELSEKNNVKKDSILLLEVKSCKKVRISKRLHYNFHKI